MPLISGTCNGIYGYLFDRNGKLVKSCCTLSILMRRLPEMPVVSFINVPNIILNGKCLFAEAMSISRFCSHVENHSIHFSIKKQPIYHDQDEFPLSFPSLLYNPSFQPLY